MYVIKVKDKDLFQSHYKNKEINEYIDSIEKAEIYYSKDKAIEVMNIIEVTFNYNSDYKMSFEIREVEIKLK